MRHKKFSSVGRVLEVEKLYKTKRHIHTIVVHCTASIKGSKQGAKDIDKMHLRRWRKKSKNTGCGYHYIVKSDGTLEKGRWVDYIGSHARGHNRGTIAVAYIGGLDKHLKSDFDNLGREQEATLYRLVYQLKDMYNLQDKDIIGHNELPNVAKDCPCLTMSRVRGDMV